MLSSLNLELVLRESVELQKEMYVSLLQREVEVRQGVFSCKSQSKIVMLWLAVSSRFQHTLLFVL